MSNSFFLLCEVCKKNGQYIPLSEETLLSDRGLLDSCIDDILVQELISCGLEKNDEPNQYGLAIESAIDYFNKFRL